MNITMSGRLALMFVNIVDCEVHAYEGEIEEIGKPVVKTELEVE